MKYYAINFFFPTFLGPVARNFNKKSGAKMFSASVFSQIKDCLIALVVSV